MENNEITTIIKGEDGKITTTKNDNIIDIMFIFEGKKVGKWIQPKTLYNLLFNITE